VSYAIRKDGQGWRAVSGPEDCHEDETWQEDQPEPVAVPEPVAQDPVEKLRVFLAANPDVAKLLKV